MFCVQTVSSVCINERSNMLQISECTRDIPCIDCDNTKCLFQGKKESDCPKYRCDRPTHGCEHCVFIDRFIEEMRKGANMNE